MTCFHRGVHVRAEVGDDFITTCKAVISVITSAIYFNSKIDDENRYTKSLYVTALQVFMCAYQIKALYIRLYLKRS